MPKACTKCGQVKVLELFHKNPRCRDGRASWCKECAHAQLKAGRASATNKERFKLYAWRSVLRSRYKIDEVQYTKMLDEQNGGCAICGKKTATITGNQRRLHVDHGPSGVRALLCNGCNRGLGLFSHDAVLLKRAAAYMEWFDAQRQRQGNSQGRDASLQA